MKKLILLVAGAMCALPSFAQVIPGAPAYQLPVTVVAQKWYGSGAPTSALNYPTQPGDFYFDTTNHNVYQCAAPVTATIPIFGGPAACTSVAAGQWTLLQGSAGSGSIGNTAIAANIVQDTGPIAIPLASLQTLNSVPLQVIAAKGAGTIIVPGQCTLDLVYGSAAFTGGGTVSLGYGTGSSPATNGTIASTVFTTFTASHLVTVLPTALAVTATASGLLNTGIYLSAASADFAAGTGGSGVLDCQYRVVSGLQ